MMSEKISNALLKMIIFLFFLMIIFSIFFIIQSSNFNINNVGRLFLPFLVVILLILLKNFFKLKSSYINILKKDYFQNKMLFIFIFILFVTQFFLIRTVSLPIGWDVGTIHKGLESIATNPNYLSDYLSTYPNNAFFFFTLYNFGSFINIIPSNSDNIWYFMQIINIILIDITIIGLYLVSLKLKNTTVANICVVIFVLTFGFSFWIFVPYTDTYVLPFIIFSLYFYINFKYSNNWISKIGYAFAFSVLLTVAYLLKPTSLILLIAIVLLEIIYILKSNFSIKQIKLFMYFIIAFGLPFFSVLSVWNYYVDSQSVVKIDRKKAMPMTHFIMMGLKDDGGYDRDDVIKTKSYVSKRDKVNFNIRTIKERLNEYGLIGYFNFLVYKFNKNVNRGDFGWGVDGLKLESFSNNYSKSNKFTKYLVDIYKFDGSRVNNLKFFMQILWLVTFIGLLLGLKKIDFSSELGFFTMLLLICLLGANLFLLIFEGGRSRYLIQFSPYIYLLSAIGYSNVINLKNKID